LLQRQNGPGREIAADGVIAGLGVRPNTALAEAAGMQVEKGIRVNGQLQTSIANIYAAGDCIDFYNPLLGQVIRAEHEEHANRSGELAGRNMSGAEASYDFLPSAYSDLFDFGFEMVGKIDARLSFVADWQSPYEKGVLYTFEQQGLAGVITINLFGKMDAARQLLRDRKNIRPENVSGRIEI
jgi:NADPH-dependent 2,4-dienoyl-CoA reductase/sulfur reductase-like enzyme